MTTIQENLIEIRKRMAIAAQQAGRNSQEIRLIAVSKTVHSDQIREALQAGVTDLGENRVQELVTKMNDLPQDVKWHLIGHLQTNKVKFIADKVAMVHSLDRWSLAEEINKKALRLGIRIPVLAQVNVAGEDSKFGLEPNAVKDFVKAVSTLPGIQLQGLMTMAPYTPNPEEVRPVFRQLKQLSLELDALKIAEVELRYLSMGMSNDFEVAIEEGANMIRVGSDIFGAR